MHDNLASVDWFVILPAVVLMVEVKSVRPTDQVRRGGPLAGVELTRMLSRAFEQLSTTNTLIEQGHSQLARVHLGRLSGVTDERVGALRRRLGG